MSEWGKVVSRLFRWRSLVGRWNLFAGWGGRADFDVAGIERDAPEGRRRALLGGREAQRPHGNLC
jgi:hypothetical protein